jgi:hypothetical protein
VKGEAKPKKVRTRGNKLKLAGLPNQNRFSTIHLEKLDKKENVKVGG